MILIIECHFNSLGMLLKMSKARQVSGDNRDSKVSISKKEYIHQQASKYCSFLRNICLTELHDRTSALLLPVTKDSKSK
uniref:Putative ovule protein n=1 Tax=Solanum chacoense TaxID=4108 RepID=A0A0V0GIN3_SOLCH